MSRRGLHAEDGCAQWGWRASSWTTSVVVHGADPRVADSAPRESLWRRRGGRWMTRAGCGREAGGGRRHAAGRWSVRRRAGAVLGGQPRGRAGDTDWSRRAWRPAAAGAVCGRVRCCDLSLAPLARCSRRRHLRRCRRATANGAALGDLVIGAVDRTPAGCRGRAGRKRLWSAHGASGAALALAELWSVTRHDRFAEPAGRHVVRFERAWSRRWALAGSAASARHTR